MKKVEIEENLARLLDILKTDAQEYADDYNRKNPEEYHLEPNTTYPYRLGVAIAVIENILGIV